MNNGGVMQREMGSVLLQVGGLELLARYSMNSGRATSLLSSLHEFRTQEAELAGNKQWNWRYLRDQFDQKSLESLYRKYDDKLRSNYMTIYLGLLTCFSSVHIVLVIVGTFPELLQWNSTYLSIAMYTMRALVPCCLLCKRVYEPLKEKYFWFPVLVTFVVIVILIITDVTVALYSNFEGVRLRPAYGSTVLLSCYIFLPMRNNYLAIVFGAFVSIFYVIVTGVTSYDNYPYSYSIVASDVIYLLGINILGVYFRLMNEIVTRRSFLDRRACVESTLKLNFEKNQEERLMLSILPEHIVSRIRQDIRTTFLGIQTHTLTYNKKTLNQLYIEEHDNVSILYADVVNYTQISTTLSPMRMVELLNELFGRFDDSSEEHDVLRIKFLGDCYYCVSGIPDPNPQHAKSCVDLGLDMISIIKDVREKRALNIDMRIGVHTGKILSGLIGIKKWQYDIWSKDVSIANRMESTGKPGKVHVTKQTLESLEEAAREYIIEPHFDAQNDPFLRKHKLETYLLSRPTRAPVDYKAYRRASVGLTRIIKKGSNRRRSDSRNSMNRRRSTAFMDNNLVAYRHMLKAADDQMEKEIEDMSKGRESILKETQFQQWVLSMGLLHGNMAAEKTYLMLPDPLFKYYISTCLIIGLLIFLINGLTTNWFQGYSWYAWVLYGVLCLTLLTLQPLLWFQFLWTKYKGIEEPRNRLMRKLYDASAHIIRSAKIRTIIYIYISLNLAVSTIISVVDCSEVPVDGISGTVLSNCISPWHVTQNWGLALLLNFLFSRVFFIFKWVMAAIMTVFYLWVVWELKSALFAQDSTWNVGLDPRVSHTLSVVFITVTLYWVDRTTEYRNRLDHMWQIQLTEKQEEASTMLKVNSMLLQNILPAHVADLYLDVNRPTDELYYEKYDNVAVMFASLTDYKLGVDDDLDMSEKMILGILDQVISDFDRLLLTGGSSIYKVEKIKMAGWTYMAACGLDPSRRDSLGTEASGDSVQDKNINSQYDKNIVITMVQFAAAMMLQLQTFNKGSFQSFEGLNLRVGISSGEVAAGVVGSLKPLYDIWGHAVNMASRMDSTGEAGKVHVTENTAIVLDDCGILTKFRGRTFVKGAGYIRTYFVPLDTDFHTIRKENSAEHFDNNMETVQHKIRSILGRESSSSSDSEYLPLKSEPKQIIPQTKSFQIRMSLISDRTNSDDSEEEIVETPC